MKGRVLILLAAMLATTATMFLFPAIPQSEAYHDFADKRVLLGIPNFLNVASNVLFLVVGLLGLYFTSRRSPETKPMFLDSMERWPYFAFFAGVTLTAFGSSYYHLRPNDQTLVWDRIPMAIGFMAIVAAVVAERVSLKAGIRLLVPLIVVGIGTVVYWDVSQARGHGDLRPYAIAQFGSLLVLVLIFALFPARYTRGVDFLISFGLYGIAKVFEAADQVIFRAGGIVSGHTLKHIAAAISAYWILRMLRLRNPMRNHPAAA